MTAATASPPGIWRWTYGLEVPPAAHITLGEGDTPLVDVPALAGRIDVASLRLKRDDLSPAGSHKARSLAWRMSLAKARGETAVVLSSSGNAAAAASLYGAAAGVRVLAFVSPDTSAVKLSALRRRGTFVVRSDRPRNFARYASRVFGIPNLTPSLDDLSIEGFKSIGFELAEEAHDATDFFSFVTSGSSFIGVARSGLRAALHAVQAGSAGRLAGALDHRFFPDVSPSQLAGLLGIDESPRADEARAHMRSGWVMHDDEILQAHEWLRSSGIDTSAEGAACVAAAARARAEGALQADARVVVLLTGHATQWSAATSGEEEVVADSYVRLRQALIERLGLAPL